MDLHTALTRNTEIQWKYRNIDTHGYRNTRQVQYCNMTYRYSSTTRVPVHAWCLSCHGMVPVPVTVNRYLQCYCTWMPYVHVRSTYPCSLAYCNIRSGGVTCCMSLTIGSMQFLVVLSLFPIALFIFIRDHCYANRNHAIVLWNQHHNQTLSLFPRSDSFVLRFSSLHPTGTIII